jgi:hypothetical protein
MRKLRMYAYFYFFKFNIMTLVSILLLNEIPIFRVMWMSTSLSESELIFSRVSFLFKLNKNNDFIFVHENTYTNYIRSFKLRFQSTFL